MKALIYSHMKYSPRVPLLLVPVEKIEGENFGLVLFHLLSFLPPLTQNLKKITHAFRHQDQGRLEGTNTIQDLFFIYPRQLYWIKCM